MSRSYEAVKTSELSYEQMKQAQIENKIEAEFGAMTRTVIHSIASKGISFVLIEENDK